MDFSPARDDYGFKDPKPCVFCPDNWDNLEIVNQAEDFAVVKPLNPVTEGHVLVIHRKHTANAGVDPNVAAELMYMAAFVAAQHCNDYNIITSAGAAATQTVFHTHIHIVPRRKGDGLPLPWTPQQAKES